VAVPHYEIHLVEDDPKGSVNSKSYHPAYVWPAICDYPVTMLHIFTGMSENSVEVESDSRRTKGASVVDGWKRGFDEKWSWPTRKGDLRR
jgi:hypothetical protein